VIDLFDRMGVPFNRTSEGRHDLRLFGGSLYKRTHFAGATTGQQLLYSLDEQARRATDEGKITQWIHWEFLRPIVDADGRCRGIVAQDQRTMQVRAFRADAVAMANGGLGLVFGKSTNSIMCNGAATGRCYRHGVAFANSEFVQVHPTAIPGADKLRLMSESARGEGGRVWVPRKKGDTRDPRQIPDAERWYFLEERYPSYGNLVPRDIATREIFNVCVEDGMGVGGKRQVYLDLSHLERGYIERKLGGIIEIYRKFVGEDPAEVPMRIFPGVHYSMGGMYVQYEAKPDMKGLVQGASRNLMTNVEGLYALGECNYQYHGANRLGANALLSCTFDGLYGGFSIVNYAREHASGADAPASLFDDAVRAEEDAMRRLAESTGTENPYAIGFELGEEMTEASTVVKTGERLARARKNLESMRERYARIRLSDTGTWTNQNLCYARALGDMLALADAMLACGEARRESRGSHYRADFPERNDAEFMKTSMARFDPATQRCIVGWETVEAPLVVPRARTYGKKDGSPAKKEPAAAGAR
jgi:succinate dehydrogenase / fumarate reductase flavoprotein subunit